jgi:hypothetical protein
MSEVIARRMMKKGCKALIGFQSQLSRISAPKKLILAKSSHRGTAPVSLIQRISSNDETSRVTIHAMAIMDAGE